MKPRYPDEPQHVAFACVSVTDTSEGAPPIEARDYPVPDDAAWRDCAPKAKSPDQKDAYLRHLRTAIPGRTSQLGLGQQVPWGTAFASNDPGLTAVLWLRSGGRRFNADANLQYALAGEAETIDAEKERWKEIIDGADRAFNADPGERRTWSAVIGPAPESALNSGVVRWAYRLDGSTDIGPISLRSLDQWVSQGYPHPSDRSYYYPIGFWPIAVSGSCNAHSTAGAEDVAAEDLDRLCRLVSLATDIPLIHWRWPMVFPRESEKQSAEDPMTAWLQRMERMAAPPTVFPPPSPVTVQVPDWCSPAWQQMEKPGLAGALEAYGSALADITGGRASAAGVQLMAVLERLTKVGKDSNAARKAAIRMVADYLFDLGHSPEDRKRAQEVVMYDERSRTVHGGRRHGSEPRLNMPMRVASIDRDPKDTYEQRVEILRHVCQALLIGELGGPVPEREPALQALTALEDGVLVL